MVPSQATYQNHRVVGGRFKKSPSPDRSTKNQFLRIKTRNLCFNDSDLAGPGNNIGEHWTDKILRLKF